jgi:hypothetical protein
VFDPLAAPGVVAILLSEGRNHGSHRPRGRGIYRPAAQTTPPLSPARHCRRTAPNPAKPRHMNTVSNDCLRGETAPENRAKNPLATLRELARLARFFKPRFLGERGTLRLPPRMSADTRLSLRSARSFGPASLPCASNVFLP